MREHRATIFAAITAVVVAACGSTTPTQTTTAAEEEEQQTPPPSGPSVRVRVASEAGLDQVDPAITDAMGEAVRNAYTTPAQSEHIRSEAVLHEMSVDASGQTHIRVRVTLVRIADERICSVLAGAAQAPNSANASPAEHSLAVLRAAMQAALRNFDQTMSECTAVAESEPAPLD